MEYNKKPKSAFLLMVQSLFLFERIFGTTGWQSFEVISVWKRKEEWSEEWCVEFEMETEEEEGMEWRMLLG